MKKTGRLITVLLVLIVAAILLYPTVKWYCFVPEDTKNLAMGTNEQIREYSRGQASRDVRSLLSLASSKTTEIPSEYEFIIELAKENNKEKGKSNPKEWTVNTLLSSFNSESELFSLIENYYRSSLIEAKTLSGNVLQLGLDLKGGVSVLLEADVEGFEEKLGRSASAEEVSQAVQEDISILSNRIDQFGLSEPDIRLQGSDQILIELAGESDSERVNSFLQGKGSLYFMIVDSTLTNRLNEYFTTNPSLAYAEDGSINTPDFIPSDRIVAGYYTKDSYGIDELKSFAVLDPSVSLDGSYIQSSTTAKDSMTNKPVVNFTLSSEGGRLFYDLTSAHKGEALAVVMDGKVKSIATINDAISSNVQISGFSESEASDLAIVLKTASFPIDLNVASMQSVGATLGDDAVRIGMIAIGFGFILIIIFMFLYYGLSGLVADFALLLNLFIMISVLSAMHFTVTLTGIAGLILTLGMAVDANVIIYERIKEELRSGKSPFASLQAGFGRAFWTIMDSNITTIIAALVLSTLGSSSVKGFAITLAVGIATSLFTSLYVSHLIFDFFIKEKSRKFHISLFRRVK